MNQNFPTDDEWAEVEKQYWLPELTPLETSPAVSGAPALAGLEGQAAPTAIQDWSIQLANRMLHSQRSYLLMNFYKRRGIADARYFASPGRNGASVEYFPDFTDNDYLNHTMFGDAADTFFFTLLSSFDSIGWMISIAYGLNLKKPDFKAVLNVVEFKNTTLGLSLAKVLETEDFIKASELRNNVVHNFRPSGVGGIVQLRYQPGAKAEKGKLPPATRLSVGVGDYVNTETMLRVARGGARSLGATLDLTFGT